MNKFMLAVTGALFALLIGIGVISAISAMSSAPPPAAPRPISAQQKKDLFLGNSRDHDWAREYAFKAMLAAGQQRCDKVTKQLMLERGVWQVRCNPGYEFIFSFDENGELKSALASPE